MFLQIPAHHKHAEQSTTCTKDYGKSNILSYTYLSMRHIILSTIGALVLATTLLGGSFTFANMQKASAQMGAGGNMTGGSNMTGGAGSGGMMGMMTGAGPNVTGSIKLSTVFGNALASQIKVSLSQAATTAENTIGNNSHAAAAHFGVVNGYFVITVWVIDGSYNFHQVIVDAGNGKVLLSQPALKGGPMMMHGMMMGGGQMMMHRGPGMMMHGWGGGGGPHNNMMSGPGMGKPQY